MMKRSSNLRIGSLLLIVAMAVWRLLPPTNQSVSGPDRTPATVPDTARAVVPKATQGSQPNKRVTLWGRMAGDGPMLISEESESGMITNTYQVSPTQFIVRVVSPHPMDLRLGSLDYEIAAKADFERHVASETNLLEIKAILEDFPAAIASQRLYSGIREAYVARARMRQLRDEGYKNSDRVSQLGNQRVRYSQQLDEAQRQQLDEEATKLSVEVGTMIRLDYRDAGERLKQRLTRLYGEFPKAVHQRLMSIEIDGSAEPLEAP